MIITCPACSRSYRLPEGLKPKHKSAALCKNCGTKIIISPELFTDLPLSTKPSRQGSTSAPAPADELPGAEKFSREEGGENAEPAQESNQSSAPINANAATGSLHELHRAFPGLKECPSQFNLCEIFPPDRRGSHKTRLNQRKYRIISVVQTLLTEKILKEHEMVHRIARGIAYYPFEIPYLNGILTILSNYYAIVCTDQRVLLLNLDAQTTRLRHYYFQIAYSDVVGVKRGLFRSGLIIQTISGQTWDFTSLGRSCSLDIQQYIEARLQELSLSGGGMIINDDRHDLCPVCFSPLKPSLSSCPQCGLEFRSPGRAMLLAALLPGLGSFYLRQYLLGTTELLTYILVWSLCLFLRPLGIPAFPLIFPGIITSCHLIAGLLANKTAKKGYIPKSNLAERKPVNSDQEAESGTPDPAVS